MAHPVTIDFTGAPPVEAGAGRADYVPPGTYLAKVERYEDGNARSGKQMFTFTFSIVAGEYAGKRLVERFTMPRDPNDSLFPKQRLHAMLVALGFKPLTGRVSIDFDQLIGKKLLLEVADDVRPASEDGRFKERTVSTVVAFLRPQKQAALPEIENVTKTDAQTVKQEAPKVESAPAASVEQTEAEIAAGLEELFED
jgi:hypothetical protein